MTFELNKLYRKRLIETDLPMNLTKDDAMSVNCDVVRKQYKINRCSDKLFSRENIACRYFV